MTNSHGEFPEGFLWGTATSAYQIEGAVNEGGRGPSIWDTFSHTPGNTYNGETGDHASGHYHRVAEDVAIMQDLGVNSYRFSIAWSRLLPNGVGEINNEGVAFYRDLCERLLDAGITPMPTLYHWDLPQALQDKGGWLNPQSPAWFTEYATTAHQQLGDLISLWSTLNEPWCTSFIAHSSGEHAPGDTDPGSAFVVAHHLMLAHHRAVEAMRAFGRPGDQFGIVLNVIPAWPATLSPADAEAAAGVDAIQTGLFADAVFHGRYPELIRRYIKEHDVDGLIDETLLEGAWQPIDFLGVNYYNINRVQHVPGAGLMSPWPGPVDARMAPPPGEPTDMGWGVEPEGLRWTLMRMTNDYPKVPLYICENGAAYTDVVGPDGSVDDPKRIAFLDGHIKAVGDAIAQGADVRGYFVWSLLDNFEWAKGYRMRFGLVHVDWDTMKRTVKSSGAWYRDFIASGKE